MTYQQGLRYKWLVGLIQLDSVCPQRAPLSLACEFWNS